MVDISHLPGEVAARKPTAFKRILGALLYRERVALVDRSQCQARVRLTEAHEIGHKIIPWHEAAFQLDDEERLLGMTRDQLEEEAYLAGGYLIFQGLRFHERALDFKTSISTPIALAEDYGASLHATIRYYVLHHPDAVAMLVAGRYVSREGSVPVWRSVESPSFSIRFGALASRMPGGRLLIASGTGQPLGDIAHQAMTAADVAAKEVVLRDADGDRHEFIAEAFFNQHNLLVLVTQKKAARFGRRVRAVAS